MDVSMWSAQSEVKAMGLKCMSLNELRPRGYSDPLTLGAAQVKLAEPTVVELRSKLVAHRGWHGPSAEWAIRPMENTRHAYISCVRLGIAFAECDVWATQDRKMVLSHDSSFASMAANPTDWRASSPISNLRWDEVLDLKLKDGSTPVLLSTVLEDLAGSATKLAVELKSADPAAPLAELLAKRPGLLASVGFVMSFSLSGLEAFSEALADAPKPIVVWLLDNPSTPYGDDINEGETTFDYTSESFAVFLERTGLSKRVKRLQCGLYLQYNPGLVPEHIHAVRSELATVCGEQGKARADDHFLGVWSDASLDPAFDRATSLAALLPVVDAVNTDLPDNFWAEPARSLASWPTPSIQEGSRCCGSSSKRSRFAPVQFKLARRNNRFRSGHSGSFRFIPAHSGPLRLAKRNSCRPSHTPQSF